MFTSPTQLALLCLVTTGTVISQETQVYTVGEIVNNLLYPSHELLGGFERVLNDASDLDDKHLHCANRQICEGMSLGAAIARSDGTFDQEKGFLRHAVDAAGDVLFEIAKPFMEVFGMSRVARQEVSFTDFLIEMVDGMIIEATRILAGRRLARQIEEFSPVATLVEPVSNVLRLIPKSYYGNVVDLVVDMTGAADRRSGGYKIMRSAGLGYFAGNSGDEGSVCRSLQADPFDSGYCGDADGAFFPLAILSPINKHKLGSTVRLGGGNRINPLMDRHHNPNALQHAHFELSDLLEPTKVLCKVDGVLQAMSGHVGVEAGDLEEPVFYDEIEEYVEIRKNDQRVAMKDLAEEEQMLVKGMMDYEKKIKTRNANSNIDRNSDLSSSEKFDSYCTEMNRKEVEKILKSVNITLDHGSTEDDYNYDYSNYEASGEVVIEEETVVVRKDDIEEQVDEEMTDIETVARIGDRSLLAEKLEVEEGNEVESVTTFINSFEVNANGKVEKVFKIDSKKGHPVLLIQFDSADYRDAVLRGSRLPESRSSSNVRFRRPKVKDLKHVVSMVKRH